MTNKIDQRFIDSEMTNDAELAAEASARQAADAVLQGEIDAEEVARAAADATLQTNINSEAAARIAADNAEAAARAAADTAEASARIAADNAEAAARSAEDLTFVKLDGSRALTGSLNVNNNSVNNVDKLTNKTTITAPTYTSVSTNGSLSLTSSSSSVHFFTGTGTGFSVILPNATTLSNGVNYELYNRTTSPITIKFFDGTTAAVLDSESVSSLILQDNSTQKGIFSPFTVEIAQAAGVLSYNTQSQAAFSTLSLTDVEITGTSITPASGEYLILFNSSNVSSTNNAECTVSLYKAGVQLVGTERTARSTASNFILQLSTQNVASFNGTEALSVRVRTTTGTLTVNNRSVVLIRLGPA